jgi:antitoxin VapB
MSARTAPAEISSDSQLAEARDKRAVLASFLQANRLDAFVISRHENVAWATAGLVDLHVGLLREVGVASLVFTRDGHAYYVTTENEGPRLADEEFSSLDFDPITQPWHAANPAQAIRSLAPGPAIAADDPTLGFPVLSIKSLRLPLAPSEIERYRWLGAHVAAAAADTLVTLRPGIAEPEMQARVARHLLARHIQPSVFLTAVDDRIRRYRHAVPRAGVLQRYGMLNFCARRWGLCISITRFVHFGPMPNELQQKFAAVAQVNARLLQTSRPGATADALFHLAQHAYRSLGYPAEEQFHHQGGATGYWEREWIARPGGTEAVLDHPQAMAWNPTIQGAKVEDTVLVTPSGVEVLTPTPSLPVVETILDGDSFPSAGVLIA